jgi:hypothetical protein
MMDSRLIELPWMRLPRDLAWRVRFVEAVEDHARKLGLQARFRPPRFCGYFFNGPSPVVMAGRWTVTLDENPLLAEVRVSVERLTSRRFSISSASPSEEPEYMLVNDGHDGTCWLWDYEHGRMFVEANEPVTGDDRGTSTGLSGPEGPKLLDPS